MPNIVDIGDHLPYGGHDARDRSQRIPGMPPAGAQWLTPHAVTFQGIFSSISRVYRMSDEALKASLDQARYMLNDPVITEPLYYRLRCLALLDWHLEPEDKKNPTEQWLCSQLTAILKRTPRFTQYRKALARAVWFGRYGVQHKWGWEKVLGERRLCIIEQKPVHGDKLVFRYDDGSGRHDPKQVGIRVGAGFSEGATIANRWRIDDLGKIEPTDRGLAYFLDPWEKDLLLAVHKAEIEDGEYEDPESAGKICGTGLRSMVYWTWYQKQELMVELLTYLDRSATGIEIMFYPFGNKTAQKEAKEALERRIGENGNALLIPRPEENPGAYGYDRIEPGMAGANILKEIIVDLFNHQIKRSIIGQTLTTETDSTGLGSNLADIHKDTFLQIIKEDATNEEETLTTDTMQPVLRCNFPKYQNAGIRFKIDTETENTEERIQALLECAQAGLPIKRQSLYDTLGEAKPEDTDEVIGGQPQGMGGPPPAGLPPAGEPGAQPPKRAMVQGGLGGDEPGQQSEGGATGDDDDPGYTDEEQQAAMSQALELDGSTGNAQPSENSERRVRKLYSAGGKEWDESKHPRGQSENAGEFVAKTESHQKAHDLGYQHGEIGKKARAAKLREAGLDPGLHTEAYRTGAMRNAEESQAAHDARQEKRRQPFLDEAKELVDRDEFESDTEYHHAVNEEADKLADAAEEFDREEADRKEREGAAYDRYEKTEEHKRRIIDAVKEALPGVNFTQAAGGSEYAWYEKGTVALKLRVSDHPQKAGGGFNQSTGERMGEADLQWIAEPDGETPTPDQIRRRIANAVKDRR